MFVGFQRRHAASSQSSTFLLALSQFTLLTSLDEIGLGATTELRVVAVDFTTAGRDPKYHGESITL